MSRPFVPPTAVIPFSHLRLVTEGDIYHDCIQSKPFQRLAHIGHLGVTAFEYGVVDTYTRDFHSTVMAVAAELILRRAGASERDVRLAIAASLLHDAATPALGDDGKLACPEELDEEQNLEVLLSDGSLDAAFAKHGFGRDNVLEAVHGKGSVGAFINSRGVDLDKVAYVATDLFHTAAKRPDLPDLQSDPYLIDIVQEIDFQDGQLVFQNPERLYRFLLARAVLFQDVHTSSRVMARKAYTQVYLRNLWEGDVLKKEDLVRITDQELLSILSIFWF